MTSSKTTYYKFNIRHTFVVNRWITSISELFTTFKACVVADYVGTAKFSYLGCLWSFLVFKIPVVSVVTCQLLFET